MLMPEEQQQKWWAVRLPGEPPVCLLDMDLQPIAEKFGVEWGEFVLGPMRNFDIAQALIAQAAEMRGIDPPDVPRTLRGLRPYFVEVDDDLPVEFSDGVPQKGAGSSTAG